VTLFVLAAALASPCDEAFADHDCSGLRLCQDVRSDPQLVVGELSVHFVRPRRDEWVGLCSDRPVDGRFVAHLLAGALAFQGYCRDVSYPVPASPDDAVPTCEGRRRVRFELSPATADRQLPATVTYHMDHGLTALVLAGGNDGQPIGFQGTIHARGPFRARDDAPALRIDPRLDLRRPSP